MTTDADEGRRQAEAMKPEPLKVGDRVRLAAGGERVMTVAALEDYGNMAFCEWHEPFGGTVLPETCVSQMRDTLPVSSLVRVG